MKPKYLRMLALIWAAYFLWQTWQYYQVRWTFGIGAFALGFLGVVVLEWFARAEQEKHESLQREEKRPREGPQFRAR